MGTAQSSHDSRQQPQGDGQQAGGQKSPSLRFFKGSKKLLHAAAKAGDASSVEALLRPLVSAVTVEMSTPGLYPGPAASDLGAAVSMQDRHGRTPLLSACLHGSWECAHLLLEAGSNILAADKEGNGCLHLASIHGHGHVVEQVRAPQSLHQCRSASCAGPCLTSISIAGGDDRVSVSGVAQQSHIESQHDTPPLDVPPGQLVCCRQQRCCS